MTLAALLDVPVGWLLRLTDRLAWRARERRLRAQFGVVGRNFVFDPVSSRFVTPHLLRAGDDCFFNAFAHVSGPVTLGDRVMAGPGVRLMSGNHLFAVEGRHPRFLRAQADNPEFLSFIMIEADVWLGAGATVLAGVTIGEGSVLAAGAVASRDVPPYVVAAGIPARPIRRIFDDTQLARHLQRLGTSPEATEALVRRRAAAVTPGLPLADPPRPARALYQGQWVELP